WVQPNGDVVLSDGLDRLAELDAPLVDLRAARVGDRLGDVGRRDCTEESARGAGLGRQPHRRVLQPSLDFARAVEVGELPSLARPADRVDLLLGTLGPGEGEPARKQVVTAVAVLHLDDVAGRTEARHFLSENELHDVLDLPQRAVEVYGNRAISRAFLIAIATSR